MIPIPKPGGDSGKTVASNPYVGSFSTGSQGKDPALLVTTQAFQVKILNGVATGYLPLVNKCYLISPTDLLDVVLKRNKNYPPGKFVFIDVRDSAVGEVQDHIPGAVHWPIKDTTATVSPNAVQALGPTMLEEYKRAGSAVKKAAQAAGGSYIVFYCAQGVNRSPLYAAAYYESVKKANNLDQKVCILVDGYIAYKTLSDKVNPSLGKGTEAYHA